MNIRKTIHEWSIEKGIRINKPNGFKKIYRENRNIYANKYTEKQYRRGIQTSNITVKTEKGLEFLYNECNKVTL